MTIIIIGASFAGLACAQTLIKHHPQARVVILDSQTAPLHYPNAANRLLKGEIGELAAAQVPVGAILEHPKVQFYPGHEVVGIDWEKHQVRAIVNQEEREFSYDRLILATGAGQSLELADEEAYDGIMTFKTFSEIEASLARLKSAQSVLVVGAGQLGMEGLDALSRLGLELTLVEAQSYPLAKHLDQDMAARLSASLEKLGIQAVFETSVDRIRKDSTGTGLIVEGLGQTYQADLVLLATNFSPNSRFLPEEIDQHTDGSVVVDAYLKTNLPDIFAVGDLIQLPIDYFGTAYLPTIDHAVLTGRLAALNVIADHFPLPICSRKVKSKVFGQYMLSLGATERELVIFEDSLSLIADLSEIATQLKLHARQADKKVLGIQLLSQHPLERLSDFLIWFIKADLSLADLLSHLLTWENLSEEEEIILTWLEDQLAHLGGKEGLDED